MGANERTSIIVWDSEKQEYFEMTGTKYDGRTSIAVDSKLSSVLPQDMVFKFMRSENTAASADMNINGSTATGSPTYFSYSPGTGSGACLNRANILILDAGITPSTFGGLATLTNGITFEVIDTNGSQLIDFNDGDPIQQNSEWVHLAGTDTPIIDTVGGNDDELAVRWTFSRAGSSIRLKETQKFRCQIRDNLSGLSEFRIMIQGTRFDID